MDKRKLCLYCGKWKPAEEMTPLREKEKDYVKWYCERCTEEVKSNLRSLPWSDLYRWGRKGEE